jgi:hypothetical protein
MAGFPRYFRGREYGGRNRPSSCAKSQDPPLIWSPLSIALAHGSWYVMVESMQGCDESIASTMDQTHIRGLVTNIPSIRRGPALLCERGSTQALPPRGVKGCPSGSHRIAASIHDLFSSLSVRTLLTLGLLRDGPDESGKLSGDGHADLVLLYASPVQGRIALAQAQLCLPGHGSHRL